jgi:hypothetical protein
MLRVRLDIPPRVVNIILTNLNVGSFVDSCNFSFYDWAVSQRHGDNVASIGRSHLSRIA